MKPGPAWPPARTDVYWIGLPVAFAVALVVVPAGVRGLVEAGFTRPNHRGEPLAFPLGVLLVTSSVIALAPLAVLKYLSYLELGTPKLSSDAASRP